MYIMNLAVYFYQHPTISYQKGCRWITQKKVPILGQYVQNSLLEVILS
jgi:hypothetical protein